MMHLVLTIDGPAGSGKSTAAKTVAKSLDWLFLDTGAMYRGLTVALLRKLNTPIVGAASAAIGAVVARLRELPAEEVERLLADADIRVEVMPDRSGTRVLLGNAPIDEAELRAPIVAKAIKFVADNRHMREKMVELQRQVATLWPPVTEGRDQGTVVFPDAPFKFFFNASIDERARRRFAEFEAKGIATSFDEVRRDVQARDDADYDRPFGALKRPDDAIVLDTTAMSPEQVLATIINVVRESERMGEPVPEPGEGRESRRGHAATTNDGRISQRTPATDSSGA